MRRSCLILVLAALITPALALALPNTQGDGSLAVIGADGTLVVQGRGVIFGYFVSGTLLILSYRPDSPGDSVSVTGASVHSDSGVTTYSGVGVRFLLPAGHYTLQLAATGIDVSAVGRGTAGASAGSSFSNGTLALDGGRPLPFARLSGPQNFGSQGFVARGA